MKKVLIAHQIEYGATIPHYRIPFYNAIEKLKPDSWCFDVVFDPSDMKEKQFLKKQLDTSQFKFPTLKVNTMALKIVGKTISYQGFWRKASKYDLIVVGQVLNNLTYPLCQLYQLTGTKFAYWGHGKHYTLEKKPFSKILSESLKTKLAQKGDGFFAYTNGGKSYVTNQGLPANKVFVLNNTIDIKAQRNAFDQWSRKRDEIRHSLGLHDKKVLLFVGRFTKDKRLDFLIKAFSILHKKDATFHLLLVGSGGEAYLNQHQTNVTYFGSITNLEKLAPIYIAADIFSFPGLVGLGPLQALCYDLPIITIQSLFHKPEIEYLSPINSVILASDTTPEDYAQAIINLFGDAERLQKLKARTWHSIKHLTIDQMAQNFIQGVNELLYL